MTDDASKRESPMRPRPDQIERAKQIAARLPVPNTWHAVLREAIDRGLPLIEAELPAGSAG